MKKSALLLLVFTIQMMNIRAQEGWALAERIVKSLDPVSFPDATYNVLDFGAKADNATPCKEAFNNAIMHCSENGGGSVIVPAGAYYMNGTIFLKSNVNLHVEENAVINFSTREEDYLPVVLTRWEGIELYNYSPFIYAYHANNIALTGKGKLNGNGAGMFDTWKKLQKKDQEKLRKMSRELAPVHERVFGRGSKLRPPFFESFGCTNVRIEGITFTDAPFWVIHPVFCNNVIVRNVTIHSYNYNNDGCDPESSSNVLIEGCDFSTGDDAIAIKSGRDNDAWRIGRATENVVIRNNLFRSKINGVCIGSEMSGGVRNIFIENIKMPHVANAIYFKSNLDRGAYIQNVWVRNIEADTVKTALIRFEPNYKGERSGFYPTLFKSFVIENIFCKQSLECGIYLSGIKERPLSNITLRNIQLLSVPVDYCLENAVNIAFDNVQINGKKLKKNPDSKPLIKLKVL